MTRATVKRVFEVDAPLEEAWRRLAEVERWAEWAPHITSVTVSPPAHIKRCLAGQAAGAQHLPHVGMGAASALGVGRRAAWGPHLLRPSVRVVGPGIDTAGMVGRAPWAPGAAHSTCLRLSVRSQSRQGDPQTAGVVSPLMAGNVGAPPCGVRRGWSANWSYRARCEKASACLATAAARRVQGAPVGTCPSRRGRPRLGPASQRAHPGHRWAHRGARCPRRAARGPIPWSRSLEGDRVC